VRSSSRVPLDELQATLLREDREADLPRMFALYLQWNLLSHDLPLHVGTDDILKDILTWGLKQINSSKADDLHPDLRQFLVSDEMIRILLMSGGFDQWKSDIVAALRQLAKEPEAPARVVLQSGRGLMQFDLSVDQVDQLCSKGDWHVWSTKKPPPEGGKMRGFSEACAHILQVGSNNTWTFEEDRYQNHIFAVVKRHNHDFSIVQGYIGEHGYDLSGWARSENKFASPQGFDGASMRQFLRHLSTFVENGAGGTFNSDNHYATFDHFEPDWKGKLYRPLFGFSEALATNLRDNSGSLVREKLIKPLIEEMDRCNCSTVEWPLRKGHKGDAPRNRRVSAWMFILGSVALAIRLLA